MKANKSTASKSTELTDAPESKVSTPNPDFIMKSDNSTNPINPVNSDKAVNSTTPANTDNLFVNEQTATEATAATDTTDTTDTTEQPKQQRVGKQQRKSDYADFKAAYLTPAKLVKRHPVNIEDNIWEKLERIARILGDRDTTVGSYINAIPLGASQSLCRRHRNMAQALR